LVDRLGARRTLDLTFGVSAAAALLVAFSPNLTSLSLTLALLGLTAGLYHPAGLSAIAKVARHPPSAIGWHGVGGNLGIAAAPIVATLVAQVAGWRWAYALLALLCLGAAVVLHTLLPTQEAMAAQTTVTPQNDPTRRAQWLPLGIVYTLSILGGFVYRGSLTFLPAHMDEQVTLGGPAIISSLTTLALLTGALGQVTGGALARRFRLEPLAACLMLPLAPSLIAVGLSSQLPLVAVYSPAAAVGRSYGIMFFASFGVGSLAGAFAGLFAERWGTGAVYLALAALALATFLLSVVLALYVARERRVQGEVLPATG
jgi:predicted MFS family arabinose efflux permease